jgi:polyhydroxyalkanoate synthase
MDLPLHLARARATNGISPASLALAGGDWLAHLAASPARQFELAASAWRKGVDWGCYLAHLSQGTPCPALVSPGARDKRFSRAEWEQAPWNALAQAFLLQQQWWQEATTGVAGVSPHHEDVVSFVARQWLDMLSPSNAIATNPQVLAQTWRTHGANLASGYANWLRDALALASGRKPRGVEAFRPGVNVAVTPGRVVMRNHLAELIQYDPATPRVDREPVLVVPSWIMKFYILDLEPHASLVRYLVERGHTVFMVSWRNPGASDAGLGLDEYLQHGVLDSLAQVRRLVPGCGVHGAGYCLGGTLLAIAAALLGARPGNPLRTVSLLAAQVDFEEPGELGLFMDESQVAFLENLMAERGYLDGVQMAGAFQLINSKDLVWSKLVHEYLMGAHTPMTALRAWNADATRMPARMHAEYLRKLYLRNDLAEGAYRAQGELVDLAQIRVPVFVVATENDHVSPWRSVYKVHHLVQAPLDFVLCSGGHNVGIVSPPSGPSAWPGATFRAAHSASHGAPLDPQAWFDTAAIHAGSWWPAWHRWLHAHSGKPVRARAVRTQDAAWAVPAPGRYVLAQ